MDHVLIPRLESCSMHHFDHVSEVRGLQSETSRRHREGSLAHTLRDHRLGHLFTVHHLQLGQHRVQGHLERVSLVDPDVLLMHLVLHWPDSACDFLRASDRMHQAADRVTQSL